MHVLSASTASIGEGTCGGCRRVTHSLAFTHRGDCDTEWIPPPHLDYGQPRVNNFHHPEKLLRDDSDDP
jgi:hypothetical protein